MKAPSTHDPVILDILVGNDWRHLHVSLKQAYALIRKWEHRGYLITPTSQQQSSITREAIWQQAS